MYNEDLKEDNIYNMDKTSLMWEALAQETLTHRGEQWVDGNKVGKDHVTVAFCVNFTGIHKLPLLFFTDMPVREHYIRIFSHL